MSNGLRIGNSHILVLMIFNMFLFTSCYEKMTDKLGLLEGEPLNINKNDSIHIEMEFYENGFLKNFITKDHLNIKNGQQLEYYPNGVLKKKYSCKNGIIDGIFLTYNDSGQQVSCSVYVDGEKNGDMYEYSPNSFLKSHILFEDGHAIYVGAYENGNKILSSPFPVFSNEQIRNDSIYEVMISFPFLYKGELEVFLRDTIDFKKEYLDKYALNLTIFNFDRSWKSFELLLEYEPSIDDSLVWTEQVYKRTIEIE
jgi:hypothetical protein